LSTTVQHQTWKEQSQESVLDFESPIQARVGAFRADLDARDDPLDAAPARGAVEEFLESAELAVLRRDFEARFRAGRFSSATLSTVRRSP